MPIELKIPEVGESITEVQIAEWLKAEGDTVKKDENVAVIDSEKTTFELPSPESGTLVKILQQAGDTVSVGTVIAHIERDGSTTTPAEKESQPQPPPGNEKPTVATKTVKSERSPKPSDPPKATKAQQSPDPEAERKAAESSKSDNLSAGATGRADAGEREKPAAEAARSIEGESKPTIVQPSAPMSRSSVGREEEVVPMTMLRRTVARRLVEAQQTMAMLTTFNEIDMSAAQGLRKEHAEAFEKRYQVKLGLMSFFVKAAIDGLKQFPQLNAEVRGNDIVYHNYFDIGVAIGAERGLVVPLLRNAERMSFAEIEKCIADFAQRARESKLKAEELESGTFTITNGGVFGSLLSTPIINPPQSGILGMHTIQDRPVARGNQVVIRPMMNVALTYDHRIVDGREAVLFLRRIKEVIEAPARMLVEI